MSAEGRPVDGEDVKRIVVQLEEMQAATPTPTACDCGCPWDAHEEELSTPDWLRCSRCRQPCLID